MTWIRTRDVFRALALRLVSFRAGECRAAERIAGVEPASPAWKAGALPMSEIRMFMMNEHGPGNRTQRPIGALAHPGQPISSRRVRREGQVTPYVITVVTPWIEQGTCRFSGDRSFRLSYMTVKTGEAGRRGPLPVLRPGGSSPSAMPRESNPVLDSIALSLPPYRRARGSRAPVRRTLCIQRGSRLRAPADPWPLGPVGKAGFEPTASCSRSRRATKLRHSPMFGVR